MRCFSQLKQPLLIPSLQIFVSENFQAYKVANPGCKSLEITGLLNTAWSNADEEEKAEYEDKAKVRLNFRWKLLIGWIAKF